jgi:hypothetical protein
MFKKLAFTISAIVIITSAYCQESVTALKASSDSLKKHIYFLASDSLMGRYTGSNGQKLAASYIARNFLSSNLAGVNSKKNSDYFQKFSLVNAPITSSLQLTFKDNGKVIYSYNDVLVLSEKGFNGAEITPYFGRIDSVKGRKEFAGIIQAGSIDEAFSKINNSSSANVNIIVIPSAKFIELTRDRFQASTPARIAIKDNSTIDAASIFEKNQYFSKVLPFVKTNSQATFIVTDDIYIKKIVGKERWEAFTKNGLPGYGRTISLSGSYKGETIKRVDTENVVGYIEGTSKKEEVIAICAHYDHIGTNKGLSRGRSSSDTIFNGADDNASGTAAILEVARLFKMAESKGYRPQRSILFLSFTAEELGLLGSDFYCKNPTIPLSSIRAVVNLDMVGRTNESHVDAEMYAHTLTLGSTTLSFTKVLDESSSIAKIDINSPISERERDLWTYGSDHAKFVEAGIPAIVITTGEHNDYHTAEDEAQKIIYPRLERIASFAFYAVWKLANL